MMLRRSRPALCATWTCAPSRRRAHRRQCREGTARITPRGSSRWPTRLPFVACVCVERLVSDLQGNRVDLAERGRERVPAATRPSHTTAGCKSATARGSTPPAWQAKHRTSTRPARVLTSPWQSRALRRSRRPQSAPRRQPARRRHVAPCPGSEARAIRRPRPRRIDESERGCRAFSKLSRKIAAASSRAALGSTPRAAARSSPQQWRTMHHTQGINALGGLRHSSFSTEDKPRGTSFPPKDELVMRTGHGKANQGEVYGKPFASIRNHPAHKQQRYVTEDPGATPSGFESQG